MEKLRTKFLEKVALYPKTYEELVTRLTRVGDVSKSLGTNEEQFERGKAFGSVYECFMYATMVGIKGQAKNFCKSKIGSLMPLFSTFL